MLLISIESYLLNFQLYLKMVRLLRRSALLTKLVAARSLSSTITIIRTPVHHAVNICRFVQTLPLNFGSFIYAQPQI